MAIPRVGDPAPAFRLPSAEGREIGLDDYRGRTAVVLWFTKGMACPFCRQQMSQLARVYPRMRERGGEVLEVTNSTPARAAFYGRRFTLPFPYLCDPDYRVRAEWGLHKRRHGPGYYVKMFMAGAGAPPSPNDYGDFKPAVSEVPGLMADEDMGVFVVDRAGIVRYAHVGAYMDGVGPRAVPAPEEIIRALDRCVDAA